MKIIKQLLTLAAAILLFTACNKNDEFAPETNSTFPADGIIRVATSVTAPQTRARMTTEDLWQFQLYIVNESDAAYSYNATMLKDDSEWGSFIDTYSGPLTLLWQNKTQPVKVSAIVNELKVIYDNDWSFCKVCEVYILQKQRSDDNVRKSDILTMKEREIDPSKDLIDGKIPIIFKHSFSKLNLTVKLGTEFNKLEFGGTERNHVYDVTVGGTNTKASLIIATDSLMNRNDPLDITLRDIYEEYTAGSGDTLQAEAKYECILIPQTVKANEFVVSLKIRGENFSWTSPTEVKLHADTQYNLTLNVGKDVVTVEGFSATPWSEQAEQDLGTE